MLVAMAFTTLSVIGSLVLLQSTQDSLGEQTRYMDGPGQCTNDIIGNIQTTMPNCRPRDSMLRLPMPDDADVVEVIPSHVVVPRCSGVCHQGNLYHHCVPAEDGRSAEKFEVMFRMFNGQMECSSVEVETHTHCKCGCDVLASHCTEKQVH